MTLPKIVANFKTTLSDELAVGGTSFDIDSVETSHGDLEDAVYAITIDEGTEDEEHIIGDLTGNTFSSLIRDVSVQDGATSQSTGRKHRRGAQVKITNFAIVQIARVLRGELTLDGVAPIRYASAHAFANARDIVDKQFVLDTAFGGEFVTDQITMLGELAGETVDAPHVLYYKLSDGRWWKADADAAGTSEGIRLAIARGAGTAGNAITDGLAFFGRVSGFTGLTPDAKVYLSQTAGGVTHTAPTSPAKTVFLGWAISETEIFFDPNNLLLPTDLEKDAMAGGGSYGTPSGDNKFVTKEAMTAADVFLVPITRVYTANATWTKPAGLKYVVVEAVGGGGNGGNNGGSGGAGGTASGGDLNISGSAGGAGTGGTGSGGTGGGSFMSSRGINSSDSGAANPAAAGYGAGGVGTAGSNPGGGGGGGAYVKKTFAAASLGATEAVVVGGATTASTFGALLTAAAGANASGSGGGAGQSGLVVVTEYYA